MAPTPTNVTIPLVTQHDIRRKRKASYRITDENFEGAESNAVTKRLKQSAVASVAAQAATVKHLQRQSQVEDIEDEDSAPVNSSPKNPNTLLEAADESDDVVMLDNDPASESKSESELEEHGCEVDKEETIDAVETAEQERSESIKT
jgi:hypothetical protein